jgi:hypothetical protein
VTEQEELKKELVRIKDDESTLDYITEMGNCNRIVYLGSDREDRLYWYISETECNDIIFVNYEVEGDEKQKKYHGWGFYYSSKI